MSFNGNICKTCNVVFFSKNGFRSYCSKYCFNNSETLKKTRLENINKLNASGRNRLFGTNNPWFNKTPPCVKYGNENVNWKGGKKTLSTGYIYRQKPGHPRATYQGYVLEHILVMEEYLGRMIDKFECVHHCNGNRSDNRIENLELMCRSMHVKLHKRGVRKGKDITCIKCGKQFYASPRTIKRGAKHCSMKCRKKH